jgi:hypothetical protein
MGDGGVRHVIHNQYLTTYDSHCGTLNLRISFLALFGLVLMVLQLYTAWDPVKRRLIETDLGRTLRILISASTVMMLVELYRLYRFQRGLEYSSWFVTDNETWRRHTWGFFLVEFVVLGLHTYPEFGRDMYDDNLGVLMLARIYLVVRVVRDSSAVYRSRLALDSESGGKSGVEFDSLFVFKYLFESHMWFFVVAAMISAWLGLAYIIWALERVGRPVGFGEFLPTKAIYMTIITMTTVGYGEVTPKVDRARVATGFAAISGLLVLALLSFAVLKSLTESTADRRVRQMLEQRSVGGALKVTAATYIQVVWRHYLEKKETPFNTPEWNRMMNVFRRRNYAIKTEMRTYRRQMSETLGLDTLVIAGLDAQLDSNAVKWSNRFANMLGFRGSERLPEIPDLTARAAHINLGYSILEKRLDLIASRFSKDTAKFEEHGWPKDLKANLRTIEKWIDAHKKVKVKKSRRVSKRRSLTGRPKRPKPKEEVVVEDKEEEEKESDSGSGGASGAVSGGEDKSEEGSDGSRKKKNESDAEDSDDSDDSHGLLSMFFPSSPPPADSKTKDHDHQKDSEGLWGGIMAWVGQGEEEDDKEDDKGDKEREDEKEEKDGHQDDHSADEKKKKRKKKKPSEPKAKEPEEDEEHSEK